MRERARHLFATVAILAASPVQTRAEEGPAIGIDSLLLEMVDRDAVAQWPDPAYATRSFSSHDRLTVAPDQPGWFANTDTGQYIRTETNGGRRESVMVDIEGPGAIVRWWAGGTTPDMGPPGTLRIYLDGASRPVYEGTFDALLAPDGPIGPPLAAIRCIGRNLYLPIPFEKACKVTYDHPPFSETRKGIDCHWYVIECRTYPAGTRVRSFSWEELERARPTLSRLRGVLLAPSNVVPESLQWLAPVRKRLSREEEVQVTIGGSRAIRELTMSIDAADVAQALRSTVISMSFDGEETVWCPVGDFYGSGVGLNPYRDWWRDVDRSGLLTCRWTMPFRDSCRIEVKNLGDGTVDVALGRIGHGPWTWDGRSLLFHAGWRQEGGMRTRAQEGFDWNYVEVQGRGIYVGDTLALHNGAGPWWGEGDEKIFVDGKITHLGTGSEDYYGYSFGDRGVFFEAPFHAEPRWEGNNKAGFVTVTRTRSLDAIPFERSLKLDLEVWHWSSTVVTYAATTYWYGRPGATSNRKPLPDEARKAVAEIGGRLPGVLEGEALQVLRKTGGETDVQEGDWRWNGAKQLWWRDAGPGDRLELSLPVEKDGRYRIVMHNTRASDYGLFQLFLDGEKLGEPIDLFSKENIVRLVAIGTRDLKAGKHILAVQVVGANPDAIPRHMLGLDYLKLEEEGE